MRTWILRHTHLIDEIEPGLDWRQSSGGDRNARERGGRVNLAGHNQSDWRLQAWALASIVKVDTDGRARSFMRTNLTLSPGCRTWKQPMRRMVEFLTVARELDPQWWQSVLRQIDLQAASAHWRRALADERPAVRRGAERTLRCLLQDAEGALRDWRRQSWHQLAAPADGPGIVRA